jgi:hypothetical protein
MRDAIAALLIGAGWLCILKALRMRGLFTPCGYRGLVAYMGVCYGTLAVLSLLDVTFWVSSVAGIVTGLIAQHHAARGTRPDG